MDTCARAQVWTWHALSAAVFTTMLGLKWSQSRPVVELLAAQPARSSAGSSVCSAHHALLAWVSPGGHVRGRATVQSVRHMLLCYSHVQACAHCLCVQTNLRASWKKRIGKNARESSSRARLRDKCADGLGVRRKRAGQQAADAAECLQRGGQPRVRSRARLGQAPRQLRTQRRQRLRRGLRPAQAHQRPEQNRRIGVRKWASTAPAAAPSSSTHAPESAIYLDTVSPKPTACRPACCREPARPQQLSSSKPVRQARRCSRHAWWGRSSGRHPMQSQGPESALCRGAPDRRLGGLGRAAATEPQQEGLQLLGARGDFVGRPSRAHGCAGGRQHARGG